MIGSRTTFLECHHKDIPLLSALIHEMSGRMELKTVDLADATPEDNELLLFGIHPLYGKELDTPLMFALHRGTLCIKNAHMLPPSTQEHLVTYMHQGDVARLKSNTRTDTDVYLLFTSPFYFSSSHHQYSAPFTELAQRHRLYVPSPLLLADSDLNEVIDGYMLQAIHESRSLSGTALHYHDREKLVRHNRPASLTELKERIYNMLLANKRTHPAPSPSNEPFFVGALADADLTLEAAARLGRNALKDRRMMTFLWRKFEKKQSTIAQFLGADRPAVCRAVKKFNLE